MSADVATLEDVAWLVSQWEIAREKAKSHGEALLIIDEIQKNPHWSDVIKQLWDEDSRQKLSLKVFMLGSSLWLIQKGIHESLAGRFEVSPITHWTFREMTECFQWDLSDYIFFGAYPGAATLVDRNDVSRWRNYINDSFIETTLSRDIFIDDASQQTCIIAAIISAQSGYSFHEAQEDAAYWGHLVESCVGAHLLNSIRGTNIKLFYWREAHKEVDFILQNGKKLTAIEVKSGKKKEVLPGLDVFYKKIHPQKLLVVGNHGVSITDFLSQLASYWA